jgi:hypothetical protein
MKEQFIFFEDSWNQSEEDTKAQPKDDYGDIHVDGVDEYFPNAPLSSTIED